MVTHPDDLLLWLPNHKGVRQMKYQYKKQMKVNHDNNPRMKALPSTCISLGDNVVLRGTPNRYERAAKTVPDPILRKSEVSTDQVKINSSDVKTMPIPSCTVKYK